LKRGDPIRDTLIIDLRDRRRIGWRSRPRLPIHSVSQSPNAPPDYVFAEYRCNSGSANSKASSCATIKPGASAGRIPAKVSLSERAIVTAGLAKEVEAVNQ